VLNRILDTLKNIWAIPELKKRLAWTLGLLAIYRLGSLVVTPGIDESRLKGLAGGSDLFGFFDLVSGGNFRRFSVFALGIMPYISASIVFQILQFVIPSLEKLAKEGETGRQKIHQYERWATIVFALVQGLGMSFGFMNELGSRMLVEKGTSSWQHFLYHFLVVSALVTGTMFTMWIGEQITERGLGNGISLIIFAGIVANFVPNSTKLLGGLSSGTGVGWFKLLIVVVLMIAIILGIIFIEKAERRIPMQVARRVRGMTASQSTYFPLKLNPPGVIPVIFASSLMMIPQIILALKWLKDSSNLGVKNLVADITQALSYGSPIYLLFYALCIFFFTYFYTSVVMDPDKIADDLKRSGTNIPGIRPGKATAEFLQNIIRKLLFVGAIYLIFIAILPIVLVDGLHLQYLPFIGGKIETFLTGAHQSWILEGLLHGGKEARYVSFGGTSLLIVIGVAMDFLQQIESHLNMRRYDGFLGKSGNVGRRVR
jgi:preprotein translocase subunit SecY